MNKPFRWNISKKEQLGRLIKGDRAESYPEFIEDLQKCCSKVISVCDNSDLIFVGRSPESIFDYLSGVFYSTSWFKRCTLLNFSMRYNSPEEIDPKALSNIDRQLTQNNLSPINIINRSRPICFIDLVASGGTLGNLTNLLLYLGRKNNLDELALKRKLRFVGITWQTKTSPNTWRWHQNIDWVENFKPSVIKNVSIPGRLWNYLGNCQKKVTLSNPPWRWEEQKLQKPPHNRDNLEALRLALYLFELGNSRNNQLKFARQLSTEPSIKYSWFRTLISEIKNFDKYPTTNTTL